MKVIEDDKFLLGKAELLKQEHPFWGYRRVWAYLRFREGLAINKKRIYRLMKENKLLVSIQTRLKAKRGKYPYRSKPKAQKPNSIWGIDMTKILIEAFGWVYLQVVLDWYSKKIVGYSLTMSSKTSDWEEALSNAINRQFPKGIKDTLKTPLKIVSDNGCQPTSERFMKFCSELGIKQIFTSYNNPKGNADTERVMRTIKEDLIWIREFESPFELDKALNQWVIKYNTVFPHSSLGYQTPQEAECRFYKKEEQQNDEKILLLFH